MKVVAWYLPGIYNIDINKYCPVVCMTAGIIDNRAVTLIMVSNCTTFRMITGGLPCIHYDNSL